VYCANNPVILIDPDGRDIDPSSEKNERIQEQRKNNPAFASVYQKLKEDPTTIYRFREMSNAKQDPENSNRLIFGDVTYANDLETETKDGIDINFTYGKLEGYADDNVLMEETYHALQFLEGKTGFGTNGTGDMSPFSVDLDDEIEAKTWAANNTASTPESKSFLNSSREDKIKYLRNNGYTQTQESAISAAETYRRGTTPTPVISYNKHGVATNSGNYRFRKPK
jgi:hypothetical protein